jgi:hypothetical protein
MPQAMRPEDRSYTVVDSSVGWKGGRFVSAVPMTAGKNAGRAIMRRPQFSSHRHVMVKLRETTKVAGAREKIFYYRVDKVHIPPAQRKTKTFHKADGSIVEVIAEWKFEAKSIDEYTFKRSHSGH